MNKTSNKTDNENQDAILPALRSETEHECREHFASHPHVCDVKEEKKSDDVGVNVPAEKLSVVP